MAQCKLCLEDKKLIKSHIIPKFMFKKMKDTNNIFYNVTYDLDTNNLKSKKTQIEDYDNGILCEKCDNAIIGGRYEKYVNTILYETEIPEDIAPRCTNYINPDDRAEYSICTNVDYKKIKLFFLSILWRASVSSRPYFDDVNLGVYHTERIRSLIFNDEYISPYDYPIVITSLMRTNNTLENVIGQPRRIKSKSNLNGYLFLIDSLQIIIYVNSKHHRLTEQIEKLCLKDDEFITAHLPKGSELNMLSMLFGRN